MRLIRKIAIISALLSATAFMAGFSAAASQASVTPAARFSGTPLITPTPLTVSGTWLWQDEYNNNYLRLDSYGDLITATNYSTALTMDTSKCNPDNGSYCEVKTNGGLCLYAEDIGLVYSATCDNEVHEWFAINEFAVGAYWMASTYVNRNWPACGGGSNWPSGHPILESEGAQALVTFACTGTSNANPYQTQVWFPSSP